ncbi:MAG: ABC transporter permease subunit [Acidimicrobiales bacterium]|nr:ABC transporter permease subunit [Acidimicrobiales bacterium]
MRSTYWTLFVAALLGVGLAALICGLRAARYHTDPSVRFDWNPVQYSARPLELTQLAFIVLGVLVVTGEYSSGMIRTSLTAVPRRGRLMLSKLVVFSAVTVAMAEAIAFAAFALGQALIHGQAPSASLHQHLVLRVVIGTGLYVALSGVLGSAVALIFRQAAAAIAVIVGLIFILPLVANALPNSWNQPIEKYWPVGAYPANAGQQIMVIHRDSHTLSAWLGLGEMALFTAIVLALGYFLLQRRDA